VKVNDDKFKELIEGTKQFEVPIWQRQYTWAAREQDQLWEDLCEQYRNLVEDGPGGGHFVGTFVLSPRDPSATGVTHFLVVDGQQRLTTLMLLLCAIRDVATTQDQAAMQRYNGLYLINQFAEGEDQYRLLPTEADREPFLSWIDGAEDSGSVDAISAAYRRLRRHVEAFVENNGVESLPQLTTALVERLELVEITTQPDDNVHRIFQSLNGTGAPLNQADLLRNHVFMLLPERGTEVYQQVWQPMEQLIGVQNLQGLARVDLLRRGEDVARDHVYEAHQHLLTPIASDEALVEERVRDFAYRATLYKKLIDPSSEQHQPTAAGFGRLARWGAQTSHPLLMVALDLRHRQILSDEQLAEVVSLVESFLVRRQLARIPTNALNHIFVQLVPRMPEDERFVETLHRELSRNRLYWPSDQEIAEALRKQPFFHIGRSNQRKLILESLERSFGHPEVVDFEKANLTVEHIMPQTLNPEWISHLEELGQDAAEVHAELVHTLGNLTLTAFNGTLSNNPFERKAQIYEASHLELNRALAENEVWGREQILARAEVLAQQIASIWPAPLSEVQSEPEGGFDWERVDRAIEAIPAGRWTSYGDLAELAGTAAVPVGTHVMQLPPGTNAYRVLTSSGMVSSNFSWQDPDDHRDVRKVLEAEGVVFDADGIASPAQRMAAESLSSLVDEFGGLDEGGA
jgi:alkylated DNA nucleotide flippase Atl1